MSYARVNVHTFSNAYEFCTLSPNVRNIRTPLSHDEHISVCDGVSLEPRPSSLLDLGIPVGGGGGGGRRRRRRTREED